MKTIILKALFVIAILTVTPYSVHKAYAIYPDPTGGGSGSGSGGGTDCGTTAPLDGGLSLLAIAGVGYGVKRFKNRKEKADK